MRSLRFTEAAEADHSAARAWYARARAGLEDEFTAAIDRAVAQVLRRPEAFRAFGDRHHRYVVQGFPFTLIYRFDDRQVIVEALFHHRLSPAILSRRRIGD